MTHNKGSRPGPRLGVKVVDGYVMPDTVLVKSRYFASKHCWVAGEGTKEVSVAQVLDSCLVALLQDLKQAISGL